MTMYSFRVDDDCAGETEAWVSRLGVERSEFLREALRRHLARLASEADAEVWGRQPLSGEEQSLASVAEWGPAEEWADWADAAR